MVRELQVMQTTRPAETRAALYRGGLVEIGARATVPAPSRAHIALAFAAIYLIWGSTYLGIRYAVETIPPLLMMGTRHQAAGLFTYAFVRRRGKSLRAACCCCSPVSQQEKQDGYTCLL